MRFYCIYHDHVIGNVFIAIILGFGPRITSIYPRQLYVSKKRRQGYDAVLRDHDQAVRPEYIITGGYYGEDGISGAAELIKLGELPGAVFAINDPVVHGAFSYWQDHGVTIPDDIALVGFSNNPNTTQVKPRLTTVNQPAFVIGETAASLLLKILARNKGTTEETIVLKTERVIRESA